MLVLRVELPLGMQPLLHDAERDDKSRSTLESRGRAARKLFEAFRCRRFTAAVFRSCFVKGDPCPLGMQPGFWQFDPVRPNFVADAKIIPAIIDRLCTSSHDFRRRLQPDFLRVGVQHDPFPGQGLEPVELGRILAGHEYNLALASPDPEMREMRYGMAQNDTPHAWGDFFVSLGGVQNGYYILTR